MTNALPKEVLTALWSYDPARLDTQIHKALIIGAVLNNGTKIATDWLFGYYGQAEVARVAEAIPRGAWDKRSLALWAAVLDIHPKSRQERFV